MTRSTPSPVAATLQPAGDPLPILAGPAVLRRLAASDLHGFQAYRRDPALARFQGWSAQSDDEALGFLAAMAEAPLFAAGEWVQLGIARPRSLELIGDVGVFLAPDHSFAEIGFTLARPAQGAGVATAAVRAAIELVLTRTAATRVIGVTDQRNGPSVRLLERVGMRLAEERDTVFKGEPCTELVFERDARPD